VGLAPIDIVLELVRVDNAGDPYGFRFGEERYLRRRELAAYGEATLDWDGELLDRLMRLQCPSPGAEAAQWIGERLRRFLEPAGWEEEERRIAAAARERRGIRITIASAAAELYALPWELLATAPAGQRLCQIPGCILRYAWPGVRAPAYPRGAPRGGREHVLFAWSAAGGAVPADIHQRAMDEALAPRGGELTMVAHVARSSLRAALDRAAGEGRPVTVLHLLCHGGIRDEVAHLLWNSDDGESDQVDPNALRLLLGPHAGTVRLVVLCACRSGEPGRFDARLGSLAQALHRGTLDHGGFEAVVASRFPLSVDGLELVCAGLLCGALPSSTTSEQCSAITRRPSQAAGRPAATARNAAQASEERSAPTRTGPQRACDPRRTSAET
jgi:hypothetical protein